MSESGYYPPGAEHDPNAPWNQVDLMDKYEDVVEEMYMERLHDVNGWFIESISEAPEDFLIKLSDLAQKYGVGGSQNEKDTEIAIGKMILSQIESYCLPSEDDLKEELGRRGND